MFSNRLTLGALAIACIAAAGAGGYFASRQNVAQSAPVAAAAPPAPADLDARNQPVQETEAVVDDGAPKAQAAAQSGRSTPQSTHSCRSRRSAIG